MVLEFSAHAGGIYLESRNLLAAGLGTRFRPQTLTTPKPLLPLLGRPILFHLLDHLIAQGVDRFVVNTHHLASVLRLRVGDWYRDCPVFWSHEEAILGTTGAIRRAAELGLLPDDSFLVVNGDLYTTFDVGRLLGARQERGVVSALAVLPNARPDVETPLWADAQGRLVAVGGPRPSAEATGPWLFTGLQSASRWLLGRLPAGASELARDVLVPSAAAGDGGFVLVPYRTPEDGLWFDLGTPERLDAAEKEIHGATSSSTSARPGPSRRPGARPTSG